MGRLNIFCIFKNVIQINILVKYKNKWKIKASLDMAMNDHIIIRMCINIDIPVFPFLCLLFYINEYHVCPCRVNSEP